MQHIKRPMWSNLSKPRRVFSFNPSSMNCRVPKCVSDDLVFTQPSPNFTYRNFSTLLRKSLAPKSGSGAVVRKQSGQECRDYTTSPFRVGDCHGVKYMSPCFIRSFASMTCEKQGDHSSKTKKEISTTESAFDDVTYNIPQKPVTFIEGSSYSLVILAAFAFMGASAYAVVKELIIELKVYKVYNLALKRIQSDSQIRANIGSPITGYSQESRNRYTRQHVPNKEWTDENGVEHIKINFHVLGNHGHGEVYAEMFKNKEDRKWKYTYLIVDIKSPTQAKIILESYLPSLKAA